MLKYLAHHAPHIVKAVVSIIPVLVIESKPEVDQQVIQNSARAAMKGSGSLDEGLEYLPMPI